MSFILGSQPKQPQAAQPTAASGVQIQTSVYAKIIPVVAGAQKIAPNIIYENNFQSIPHETASGGGGGGGGKGGGGQSNSTSVSYTYTDGLELLLCHGPISGVGAAWSGKTSTTLAEQGYTLFTGTTPQAGWSQLANINTIAEQHSVPLTAPYTVSVDWMPVTAFTHVSVKTAGGLDFTQVAPGTALTANEFSVSNGIYSFAAVNAGDDFTVRYSSDTSQPVNQALHYNGFAYVANWALDLGTSPNIPNHNFEVWGFLSDISHGVADVNPSAWTNMILTDQTWGIGTAFPAARIGDLTVWSNYAVATGLMVAVAYTEQAPCASAIDDLTIFTNTDVAITTTMRFLPRGDTAITANGVTYTPPTSSFSLTDDDWIAGANAATASGSNVSDALVASRADSADIVNQVSVEFLNRANGYNPQTVTAEDLASIQKVGEKPDTSVRQAHLFANGVAAHISTQLLLQRGLAAGTWSGTVGEHCAAIELGDVGNISSLLSGVPSLFARVKTRDVQTDRTISFVFQEIKVGAGTTVSKALPHVQSTGRDYNVSPGNTDAPVIFEAPLSLVESGSMEVWIYANGGANWGGCEVWLSSDNQTHAKQGVITGRARIGALTAPLAAGVDPDTVNTLSLKLVENGQILSGSQTDADSFNTDLWVDGEILSYATANLTGTNAYNLSYLRRGGYATANSAHASGARLVLMDKAVMRVKYTAAQIGKTLYMKLLAFNQFGSAIQQLDAVEPFSYTITGMEAPPDITGMATAYIAGLSKLVWNNAFDPRSIDYEVRQGQDWKTGQLLGNPTVPQCALNGDGTYWCCARFQVPNGPTVYSAHPASITVAGSALAANMIASFDQAALGWPGSFANTAKSGANLTLLGGDILSDANILATGDLITYGGVAGSGSYQVAAANRITVSAPTVCNVVITTAGISYNINSLDITQVVDITAVTDLLNIDLGHKTQIIPQVRLSQDGVNWGPWQNWTPGSYLFKEIDFQLLLTTSDQNVTVVITDFSVSVNVPNRIDNYSSITTSAITGQAVQVFTTPFNGAANGALVPHILYAVENEQAGDVVNFAATLAQVTITITNGGLPASRTLNITAQGY